MKTHPLSEKWIKASIAGSIWAASEIVLGSFLHNLKIPFSSNILTAIGIIVLVSIGYLWHEKGLFWRAGLLCALMKTMSPSAVIFGPMIAIFAQSVLLETSVRLLGQNMIGYFLGSMLAMSWNFFQKIINYIIFYGYNIVEIYKSLVQYAGKQLTVHFDVVWLPIVFLFLLYAVFGAVAAILGIRIGRKLKKEVSLSERIHYQSDNNKQESQRVREFNYSLLWLIADVVLIVGSLLFLSLMQWRVWISVVPAVVLLWSIRYKRSLRHLRKPGFWVFFITITMLSTLVFSRLQKDEMSVSDALLIGIQMNFRAVIMLIGFSAIGTELYNPVIRAFFLRTSFRQLPLALELAFESLPAMIAFLPPAKTLLRNPVFVMQKMLTLAESRLDEIRRKQQFRPKVYLVTGKVGEGKTQNISKLIEKFQEKQIAVGGILSLRIMQNGETMGYNLVDVSDGRRCEFLRLIKGHQGEMIGRFAILPQGLNFGEEALSVVKNINNKLVIIDEIGKLELSGHGWANQLRQLLESPDSNLLLSVRDTFVEEVKNKWSFTPEAVFMVDSFASNDGLQQIADRIINDLPQ